VRIVREECPLEGVPMLEEAMALEVVLIHHSRRVLKGMWDESVGLV
jgi:hypothetical protein